MRLPIQTAAIFAMFLARVSAQPSGLFTDDGVPIERSVSNGIEFFGEGVSFEFLSGYRENADPPLRKTFSR